MMRTEHLYRLTRSLAILDHSNKMWFYAVKCKVIHLAEWNQTKGTDFILLQNRSEKYYSRKKFNMDSKGNPVIKHEQSYPGTSKLMISE